MTTRLGDILDTGLLAKHIAEGNIKAQVHPELPLTIYNYTAQCQYAQTWDEATGACRGLIVDTDSDRVVARPFRKFFNHNQPEAPTVALDAAVSVTDKADGSLGILYPTPKGHAIATRGSFTSEQAMHATEVWRERYEGRVPVNPALTYLFEIVYPANRIVVDYGDMDDLVFLGAVEVATGKGLPVEWFTQPWPKAETFAYESLAAALAAPPRPNAEGLVVHCLTTDERVKIKQDDYLALHRIVTGLNARTVWEHLAEGGELNDLLDGLPDEFHDWVTEVAAHLVRCVEYMYTEANDAFRDVMGQVGLTPGEPVNREDRKRFAELAVKQPVKWALFALLDGKDIRAGLWRSVKPAAHWTPSGRTFTEDTA